MGARANIMESESHSIGRRNAIQLAGAALGGIFLASTKPAFAQMAPMGADVLDRQASRFLVLVLRYHTTLTWGACIRPEFRKRQDLVLEPIYTPEEGVLNLPVPINGKDKPLKKLLGEKATIVMNIKLDDPETSRQIPALRTVTKI